MLDILGLFQSHSRSLRALITRAMEEDTIDTLAWKSRWWAWWWHEGPYTPLSSWQCPRWPSWREPRIDLGGKGAHSANLTDSIAKVYVDVEGIELGRHGLKQSLRGQDKREKREKDRGREGLAAIANGTTQVMPPWLLLDPRDASHLWPQHQYARPKCLMAGLF